MFADSMLETSWAQRSRRGWVTLTSFGLQLVAAGVLLLLPLIGTTALPQLRPLSPPVSLAPPPAPPPTPSHPQSAAIPQSNMLGNVLLAPQHIPTLVPNLVDNVVPPQLGPSGPYVPGSTGSGDPNGILNSIGNGANPLMPRPLAPTAHLLRISHMSEGDLIHRVQPDYPPLARSARIQGSVLLQAVISRQGTIENLRVLSGHPMLVRAAIDAVSQWRYRPYILNNEPVEVETQITVNFSLFGG
jgi:periplasmic protein TonB